MKEFSFHFRRKSQKAEQAKQPVEDVHVADEVASDTPPAEMSPETTHLSPHPRTREDQYQMSLRAGGTGGCGFNFWKTLREKQSQALTKVQESNPNPISPQPTKNPNQKHPGGIQ